MEGVEEAQTSLPQPPSSHQPSDQKLDSSLPSSSPLPLSELADEELRAKIVRQVEFYFSDANLGTDDFLLNILRRPGNSEAWVPIKTLASFAKMKKLTKNIQTIVAALRTSTEIEVSPEGQRVRRLTPFDLNIDLQEIRSKTVITWNLPEKPTIEYVIDLFSTVGVVEMARIRKTNHPEPLLTRGIKIEVGKNARECYALIEYKTREDALKAVKKLHDESNWRSGLRVKLLVPQLEKERVDGVAGEGVGGKMNKTGKKTKVPLTAAPGDADSSGVAEEAKERPKPAWTRGGSGSVKLQRDSFPADGDGGGGGGGNENSITIDSTVMSKAGSSGTAIETQPQMPDAGSRGFGIGRGTVASTSKLFKLLALGEKSDRNTAVAAPGSLRSTGD